MDFHLREIWCVIFCPEPQRGHLGALAVVVAAPAREPPALGGIIRKTNLLQMGGSRSQWALCEVKRVPNPKPSN